MADQAEDQKVADTGTSSLGAIPSDAECRRSEGALRCVVLFQSKLLPRCVFKHRSKQLSTLLSARRTKYEEDLHYPYRCSVHHGYLGDYGRGGHNGAEVSSHIQRDRCVVCFLRVPVDLPTH